jgi:rubrerythrin
MGLPEHDWHRSAKERLTMAEKLDRMASIKLAIKNEKTEWDFYQHEASRSKNPLAKAMFEQCAKDEQEHMRRIQGLHDKLVKDGSWPEDAPIEVAGTNIDDALSNLVTDVGSAEDHDMDDEDALARAITFEAKGMEFYARLRDACDNSREKEFFGFLAKIEREHYLILTESLNFLRDPEAWMEEREKSGLDGA